MDFEQQSKHTEAELKLDEVAEKFWDKTILLKERLLADVDKAKYFEEGYEEGTHVEKYQDRPLIARDRPILGGVYLGAGAREAIVVDEKYGELLPVYEELLKRREQAVDEGGEFKNGVLAEVWNLTKEILPYDSDVLDEVDKVVEEKVGNTDKDNKVTLDVYIRRHGGVCRHQALLAGYLLEKLITEEKISGHVSVDRNAVPTRGGHAWVRYTNSRGKVFIIDPAQNYIGPLDSEDNKTRWFYERPEDLKDRPERE